jgi:hypothetical protein
VTDFKSNAPINIAGGKIDLGRFCGGVLEGNGGKTIDAAELSSLALRMYAAQVVLLISAILGLAIVAANSQGLYAQELIDDRANREFYQEEGVQLSPLTSGKSHPKSPEHQQLDVNDSDDGEAQQF